jgi:hypothetical protein
MGSSGTGIRHSPYRHAHGIAIEAGGTAQLNELRKDGALTDEQYQRAVDRLLEGDGS